jgi:hypothetical protein
MESRKEPKEPEIGTEKFGSCLVHDSWEPNYLDSFGSVLEFLENQGNSPSKHIVQQKSNKTGGQKYKP